MSEWWTYRLSDLLLFSPETYRRLFELYHRDVWPLQALAAAFGIATAILLARRRERWAGRAISICLAMAWLWIAWAFHLRRYGTINWAATWFAALFAAQAVLLLWGGVVRPGLDRLADAHPARRVGLLLFLFALFVHPLLGFAAGRSLAQAELFALTPDATAVGTLGLVIAAGSPRSRLLLIIPLSWCGITAATLLTMRSAEAWAPAAAVAAALASVLWLRR
jgi:hypothetical protein